ncbi:hypothetical protein LTR78_009153 [Recurvomyces mirabilis]|uniref:Uncharacterized protein n=1 Tax=Recurvomyces mirabilis TaxID=574656 RepID=A0AAE0WIK9_9PEZI|nr:hypothetical protein LTR78_009153 [Recurvomyces mirabilis]KAK5161089.1 hypothetical protein LTS14_000885 [Recurvomyces mirabilis]
MASATPLDYLSADSEQSTQEMMMWPAGYDEPQPSPRSETTDADFEQALASLNSMREKIKQQAEEYRELESGLRASTAMAALWERRFSRKEARAANVVAAAEEVLAAFGDVLGIGPTLVKLQEALEGEE